MNKRHTKKRVQSKRTLARPVVIALAVAIFGILGMLVVDHGPWNKPKVQTADNNGCRRARRRSDGHADPTQAGGGARRTRAEARSTGEPDTSLGTVGAAFAAEPPKPQIVWNVRCRPNLPQGRVGSCRNRCNARGLSRHTRLL